MPERDLDLEVGRARRERETRRARAAERVEEGRKLYSDDDGKPSLLPSFAVYIDALGTKRAMEGYSNDDLKSHLELLDRLQWFLHAPEWEGDLQRFLSFSDNLVLGVPLHRDGTAGYGLGFFLDSVASYQLHMSLAGRFQRGGIATGMLYIDQGFVVGGALVDAVVLEEDVAVHPRIVLSEECAAITVLDGRDYGDAASSPWNDQLLVDADGRVFVDYLSALLDSPSDELLETGVAEHRDRVEAALASFPDSGRIREKYRWVAEYHNFVCDRWKLAENYRVEGLNALERLYSRSFRTYAEHAPLEE